MRATKRFATDATWAEVTPSHNGLESRCRTVAGPSRLALRATGSDRLAALTGLRRPG